MNAESPLIAPGTILLGRYLIEKYLDQGGMQQVFVALDRAFDRRVVVKTPLNTSAKMRFEPSARLSAGVSHPNVAKTLDYAVQDGLEFLVEEFVPGENLQKRLNRNHEYLDPFLAAHLIHHLAKAVRALGERGIIHRDLKPSNIMVSLDPGISVVKITDFGIAKLAEQEISAVDSQNPLSVTASKTMVGALPFMAPELFRKRSSVDKTKADVWATGALLYKLLFGVNPFPADDIIDVMGDIANQRFEDRSAYIESVSLQFRSILRDLWEIIKRCLVVEVSERVDSPTLAGLLERVCYNSDPRQFGNISYLYHGPANIGTITSDSGEQVFVHFGDFYSKEKPEINDRVLFSRYDGHPRPRAFPVLRCKSTAQ